MIRRGIYGAGLALVVSACADGRETTLTVRTDLPRELRDFVEASFEEAHLDVDVRFTEGAAAGSFHDLQMGADEVPFDVWWGAPATTLESAGTIDLLEPFRPTWAPTSAADDPLSTDVWQPVLVTPFVIAFNREEMTITRAPSDWVDTFHHRWTEEVWALDPTRHDYGASFIGSMLVEALRDDDDLRRGFDWLDRLDTQVERYVSEPDEAIRALERGDALLAILPRALVEEARGSGEDWLYYRLPTSGSPVLALGVGIAKGSMARNAAARFVEHLGTLEVTTESYLRTRWQPAYGQVDAEAVPPGFELAQQWRGYPLAVDTLVAELEGWVTRWDLDVRGTGK